MHISCLQHVHVTLTKHFTGESLCPVMGRGCSTLMRILTFIFETNICIEMLKRVLQSVLDH